MSSFDYPTYRRAELTAEQQALAFNRPAVLAAMKAAGLTGAVIRFDGEGDSGQIEEVTAIPEDVELESTNLVFKRAREMYNGGAREWLIEDNPVNLYTALEQLCYDALEIDHPGWEINEGAFGEIHVDVAAGTVTLQYNQRVDSSEYSESEY